MHANKRRCNLFKWLSQKDLSLLQCWEQLKCDPECDLSDGLFQYADGKTDSQHHCGCSTTSDCKTNNVKNPNHNIYQYTGGKSKVIILKWLS